METECLGLAVLLCSDQAEVHNVTEGVQEEIHT